MAPRTRRPVPYRPAFMNSPSERRRLAAELREAADAMAPTNGAELAHVVDLREWADQIDPATEPKSAEGNGQVHYRPAE